MGTHILLQNWVKIKKYYQHIFFHLVDLVVMKEWLLYRWYYNCFCVAKSKQKYFLCFKTSVAESLEEANT